MIDFKAFPVTPPIEIFPSLWSVISTPVKLSWLSSLVSLLKDSFNMDGTLPTYFTKSETMRNSKMLLKSLLNSLKKDIDFQN